MKTEKDRQLARMRELTDILNEAARAYYSTDKEIMSNYEYDALYDELASLEKKTGIVNADSPTVRVGYEVLSKLPKERHEQPMLSLDKTKEVAALEAFAGNHKALLSWKMDGLTIVLTYENGTLKKAVTRGNGEVGEVITNNAKTFKNLPLVIPYKGTLIIRGEAVISYADFEKINEGITDADEKYKNPRNLCSGSVRQLNNEITAKRNVNFFAFSLVSAPDVDFKNSREEQLKWLMSQGFRTVEYTVVTAQNMEEAVKDFAQRIESYDFPSDGLVLLYDDIEYGRSLGRTAKFPKDSIAFKWADEVADTTLLEIEWSPSRTGLINPVAIFSPVELEGTTVSRASVHNLSIMESLELGIGDTISVYKANMIIPQIAENKTRSGRLDVPKVCPACGEPTVVRNDNGTKTLFCDNAQCMAKHIKSLSHFVSRDAMNIDGLSENTLEKFVAHGFIKEYADIYKLNRYENEIVGLEGFGKKSYDNLISAADKARTVNLPQLIYSLGIPNVGLTNAKMICKAYDYSLDSLRRTDVSGLSDIEGIGDVIAGSFVKFFEDERNNKILDDLLSEINIVNEISENENILEGKVFVITGAVEHFANRNELKDKIESYGGKVTGSVTGNTSYLINNDVNSTSSKNKTAQKLGVPIISEEEFLKMLP